MKRLLKRAVESQPVPSTLAERVRQSLREPAAAPLNRISWRAFWMWPAFATAAAALAFGIFWFRPGDDRPLPGHEEQTAYISRVSERFSGLMRIGLGDHIHCALFRKYPRETKPLAEMKKEVTPQYAGLLDAAQRHAPAGYRVAMAHKCRFQQRDFVHLVLKKNQDVVSLVVASRQGQEAFEARTLVQGLRHAGLDFYQESDNDFRVAAFEAKSHFVYVISSLPAENNLNLMAALADDIRQALPAI
jgi:hypothetical protein